jgi:hypothetical protein
VGHPVKWDPADYLPTASEQTKADVAKLVILLRSEFRQRGVPAWLIRRVDSRVTVAWLAVRGGAVERWRLHDDLFGVIAAIDIYVR